MDATCGWATTRILRVSIEDPTPLYIRDTMWCNSDNQMARRSLMVFLRRTTPWMSNIRKRHVKRRGARNIPTSSQRRRICLYTPFVTKTQKRLKTGGSNVDTALQKDTLVIGVEDSSFSHVPRSHVSNSMRQPCLQCRRNRSVY